MTAGNGNAPQHTNSSNEKFVESMMNLALLDPPRWGWPALGPVTDLLSPHEVCLVLACVESYVHSLFGIFQYYFFFFLYLLSLITLPYYF